MSFGRVDKLFDFIGCGGRGKLAIFAKQTNPIPRSKAYIRKIESAITLSSRLPKRLPRDIYRNFEAKKSIVQARFLCLLHSRVIILYILWNRARIDYALLRA